MNRQKPLNKEDRHLMELHRLYEESLQRSEIPQMEVSDFLDVAEYCYLNQSPEKAVEVMQNALTIHPMDDELICNLGIFQLECGWDKEARRTYEMISDKTEMFARGFHANLLLLDGRVKEAMDVFMDEELEPFEPLVVARLLMRSGYKKEALSVLDEVKPYDEEQKFTYLELMADLKTDMGCYEEAEKLYEQLLDMDPYDASNWYELGCCHYKNDNLSKAIECLDYALVANPKMSMAYQVRGECFILLGNIDKGCKDLTQCASLNGLVWEDLVYFIETDLIDRENLKAARKVLSILSKAANMNMDLEARCDMLLTLSYVHLSLGEHEQAEQCVDQALKMNPSAFHLHLTKGMIRMDRGDYYGGRKHLDSLARECQDPFFLATLAEAMLEKNHPTDALSYMDKAVSLDSPENLCVNCLTTGHSTAMQFLAYEYCAAKPDMDKLMEAFDAFQGSDDPRQRHNILTKVSRMLMSPSSRQDPRDRKNKNKN